MARHFRFNHEGYQLHLKDWQYTTPDGVLLDGPDIGSEAGIVSNLASKSPPAHPMDSPSRDNAVSFQGSASSSGLTSSSGSSSAPELRTLRNGKTWAAVKAGDSSRDEDVSMDDLGSESSGGNNNDSGSSDGEEESDLDSVNDEEDSDSDNESDSSNGNEDTDLDSSDDEEDGGVYGSDGEDDEMKLDIDSGRVS
ncbi:uncharacterized protein BDZ99DRAFT_466562 [Mytilinidion resinicola]|uniref:Uncharacterized protein n=1 Tax=Mytilinidion resinicola TaxID=574789 RepID=A0A6A6YAK9_9PEZI|nr:uncharacterized protein BDZ99DRAFT_466562 [Mytilinidion resinicola]KAF2805608.1 hypothetical protein BDZ99DRAFT_466562 [Mytilinidion resinicola]